MDQVHQAFDDLECAFHLPQPKKKIIQEAASITEPFLNILIQTPFSATLFSNYQYLPIDLEFEPGKYRSPQPQ